MDLDPDQVFETHKDTVARVFAARRGLDPMGMIYFDRPTDHQTTLLLVPCPPGVDIGSAIREAAGKLREQGAAVRATLAAGEAWFVTAPSPDMALAPSRHPDRREGLFLVLETASVKKGAVCDIVREEGKAPTLGPWDWDSCPGAKLSGLVFGAFDGIS